MSDHHSRTASEEQKAVLKDALMEVQRNMSRGIGSGAFGATHAFSQELITDVVAKCDHLFTMELCRNVRAWVKWPPVHILLVVANIQMRTLKTEVEKGSM